VDSNSEGLGFKSQLDPEFFCGLNFSQHHHQSQVQTAEESVPALHHTNQLLYNYGCLEAIAFTLILVCVIAFTSEAHGWLVLRLLCGFRFCWYMVFMCSRTFHVRNNYITYIVAIRPYFSRPRQFRWLLCV